MVSIRRPLLIGFSTLLVTGAFGVSNASAAGQPAQDLSRGGRATTFSSNWSGYAAYANSSGDPITFSHVAGDWYVPAVDCSHVKGQQLTIATSFVGLDGYFTNTVEQNGTDADCIGQNPYYVAWYEFYPQRAFFYDTGTYPVAARDHMHAEVTHSGNTTTVSLRDITQGWGPVSQTSNLSYDLGSAEWILEAPASKLSKFTTDATSAHYTNASATGGGTTGGIDSFTNDKIIMVRGRTARATPSDLTSGNEFTVAWNRY